MSTVRAAGAPEAAEHLRESNIRKRQLRPFLPMASHIDHNEHSVQIVVTERPHEPCDLAVFEHCGIDPRRKTFLMLKSRIHYRAAFKPIASHVVSSCSAARTVSSVATMPP